MSREYIYIVLFKNRWPTFAGRMFSPRQWGTHERLFRLRQGQLLHKHVKWKCARLVCIGFSVVVWQLLRDVAEKVHSSVDAIGCAFSFSTKAYRFYISRLYHCFLFLLRYLLLPPENTAKVCCIKTTCKPYFLYSFTQEGIKVSCVARKKKKVKTEENIPHP